MEEIIRKFSANLECVYNIILDYSRFLDNQILDFGFWILDWESSHSFLNRR
jgi:hypothetical protein